MTQLPDVTTELLSALGAGESSVVDWIRFRGGTPIVRGTTATFVFVGDAEEVALKHWMDTFPPVPNFERIGETNVWVVSIDLPASARIEYKLAVRRHGRRRLHIDTLNPRRAEDPAGFNSVAAGSSYERPSWSLPDSSVQQGTFTRVGLDSSIFAGSRSAAVYRPVGTDHQPLPLLLFHDGSDYHKYAAVTTVLDNLMASGEIAPAAAAFIDPQQRTKEYAANPDHADHLVTEVIPAVSAATPIDSGRTIAVGASLGGVASLHAARRHPGVFSALVLQSGSFVTSLGGPHRRGPVFVPVVAFMREFEVTPGVLPATMHLSCGRYDGLHADDMAMAQRLSDRGVNVGWEDALDGHHWGNWRDRLRAGLRHVLPGSHPTSERR